MTQPSVRTPRWYVAQGELLDPKRRHQWLISQLHDRRRRQAAEVNPFAWLSKSILDGELSKLFEVLSEGLGGPEPYWWGLRWTAQEALSVVLAPQEVQDLTNAIHERRQKLSPNVVYKTQREIGRDLYEPTVFCVSEQDQEVFCFVEGSWLPLSEDVELPVIVSAEDGEHVRDLQRAQKDAIRQSLLEVSQQVLWPGFFRNDEGACVSIVYIHTSLFHQGAGVWVLHGVGRRPSPAASHRKPSTRVVTSTVAKLVAPAAYCLEDAFGWGYEAEGLYRRQREYLEFFRRCTGRGRLPWTADGAAVSLDDRDRLAFYSANSVDAAGETQRLYELACEFLAVDTRPVKAGPLLPLAERSIEECFVAWRFAQLSDAAASAHTTARMPPVHILLLRDVASSCSRVLEQIPFNSADDPTRTHAQDRWVLLIRQASTWAAVADNVSLLALDGRKRFAGLLVASLMIAATLEPPNPLSNLWLQWCLAGFKALAFSSRGSEHELVDYNWLLEHSHEPTVLRAALDADHFADIAFDSLIARQADPMGAWLAGKCLTAAAELQWES